MLPHEHFITANVWLTLGTVQNERVDGTITGLVELFPGWKSRAAEPDYALFSDALA